MITPKSPQDFYSPDLAHIHHTGYTTFAATAAKGILPLLQHPNLTTGHIVDLGCGSAPLAATFIQHGYTYHGIDVSPAMVAIAQTTTPAGTYTVGSIWNTPIPECSAVISIGECLNADAGLQYP